MGSSRAEVSSEAGGASVSTSRFWGAVTATDDDRGEASALVIQRMAELGHEADLQDLLRPDRNQDDVTLTAFLAAAEGDRVEMVHIVRGLGREMQKLGRLRSAIDFGPYHTLLE